jgi:hypothetical protein
VGPATVDFEPVLRFQIAVVVFLGVLFASSTLLLSESPCPMGGGGTNWGVPIRFYTQCGSGPAEVDVSALLLDLAFWYGVSLGLVFLFHITTPPWERAPRDSE